MLTIFTIILPIFLLIGMGYLALKTGVIKPEALPSIGGLVLYFTLPATLFSSISRIQFSEVIEPHFLVVYALAGTLTFASGLAINHWVLKQDLSGGAVRALGMSLPNSIFIGFPILLLTMPDVATIAFVMAVLVENIVILPLTLILLEYALGKKDGAAQKNPWKMIGLRMIKNPILIAIFAGAIASLVGLELPKPLAQTLDLLARASAAFALIFIGATLASNQLKGNVEGISIVVLGKLALMPLLAAFLVWLLPDFDSNLQKSLIVLCAVPMFAIYPIIGERAGYRAFCSNALMVTTIAGFFSITLILSLVGIA